MKLLTCDWDSVVRPRILGFVPDEIKAIGELQDRAEMAAYVAEQQNKDRIKREKAHEQWLRKISLDDPDLVQWNIKRGWPTNAKW